VIGDSLAASRKTAKNKNKLIGDLAEFGRSSAAPLQEKNQQPKA
jgi:hypothetical protein